MHCKQDLTVANPVLNPRETDVRERIFGSALRHFSQKGYAATTLREIALDAGTTKPMIYYYFGSKDGLYSSIVREILEEMAGVIRDHVPPKASAADQAIAFAQVYLDHFLANEEIIALVLREVFGLGGQPMAEFANTLAARVVQPLVEILARGMELQEFRQDQVVMCSTAVTGILNMFILAHVFGGAPIDREHPLEQVRHYLRGLACTAEHHTL